MMIQPLQIKLFFGKKICKIISKTVTLKKRNDVIMWLIMKQTTKKRSEREIERKRKIEKEEEWMMCDVTVSSSVLRAMWGGSLMASSVAIAAGSPDSALWMEEVRAMQESETSPGRPTHPFLTLKDGCGIGWDIWKENSDTLKCSMPCVHGKSHSDRLSITHS